MPQSDADKEFSVMYSEAAKVLHDMHPPHYLAKVNDGENPYIATKFNVDVTPSLKWFENGKVQDLDLNF